MATKPEIEARARQLCGESKFDEAATCALKGYGPGVMGLLVKMTQDEDQASDVFSMFCEDMWGGLPGFRWEASLKNWVYRLAIHAHRRYVRDPLRKRGTRLSTDAAGRLPEVARTMTRNFVRTTVKDQFKALRADLKPQEQALLTLRLDRGMDWNEIALVMLDEPDPTPDAIRKEAQRQRKGFSRLKVKLTELLKQEGVLPR